MMEPVIWNPQQQQILLFEDHQYTLEVYQTCLRGFKARFDIINLHELCSIRYVVQKPFFVIY